LLPPIRVDFGKDGDKDLFTYVCDNLRSLKMSFQDLHTSKVAEWRRLTKGIPREKTRSFPWDNASNVIIQLIGENVEVLKAVQLGTIYEILPLWTVGLVGSFGESEQGEEQRSISERFLDLMGLTKCELDLYRVESKAAHDIASLGSVLIKFPWITVNEQVIIGYENGGLKETTEVMYDGPRPEKLAYEDWMVTPTAPTWEDADFKCHELRLTKQKCEQMVYEGHFGKKEWEQLVKAPDLYGFTEEENKKMQEQNITSDQKSPNTARWRFYECWFKYRHNNKYYKIIFIAHLDPDLKMGAIFNFYPKNEEPFEYGRLGFSEDNILGYGFAEMGEMYQEDVSTKHNQRSDNHTLQNAPVILGGNNPRIDAGVAIFPMAVLPFDPKEVEVVHLGTVDESSVAEEQLTIAEAKARFGTDMLSAEGYGSGQTTRKGGYSSMGTFSIMQQGARRINVNVTDFRYLHLNVGQKLHRQYATFGIGENRLKYWGKEAELLQRSLDNVRRGRIELPIRAAMASINKEIEKQTGMLFTQVMQRHYGAITQMLQGAANPVVAQSMPEIPEFLVGSIAGLAYIMSRLLRAFGYDDINRAQPELQLIQRLQAKLNQQKQQQQQQQQRGASNVNNQRTVPANAGNPQNGNREPGIQEIAGAQGDNISSSPAASAETSRGILLH